MRIGIGYDAHRFTEGRPLILGGVDIPYEKGLEGHSDADVLAHAIADALLGALGLGDIGKHFPDTDPQYKGISSILLIEKVRDLIYYEGWIVSNVDTVLIMQKPKIASYIDQMRKIIAGALWIDVAQVSVKATTTEKMGFEGREEGISAQAVCLLQRK